MSPALVWDESGERLYETGIDHGVLYPINDSGVYTPGVAWNGLTTVTETPAGAAATPQFADNIKYLNLIAAETFGATIQAFTYPDEFAVMDGSVAPVDGVTVGQQNRGVFGLCYRTVLGNDTDGTDHGFRLHMVYGCQAAPSQRAYATINDSPAAIDFSWDVSTTPVPVAGYPDLKPTALLVVDSTVVDPDLLTTLLAQLYGGTGAATLPLPGDVLDTLAGP